MKTNTFYLLPLLLLFMSSCRSTRSMRLEFMPMRANLFYELTTPEYFGPRGQDVYLDFIGYSNIDYYSSVKKTGGYFIPLIVYYVEVNKFRMRLGEGSLTQTYREFLTDALLAECNSSAGFNLIDNKDCVAPDSAYSLKVRVIQNETGSRVKLRQDSMLWFDGEALELPKNLVEDAWTHLALEAQLTRNGEVLLLKTYELSYVQSSRPTCYDSSVVTNEACLNLMAESLSQATKQVVENMSRELQMLLNPMMVIE